MNKPLKTIYLLIIFLLLLTAIGFYSCKKDKGAAEEVTYISNIKGKWVGAYPDRSGPVYQEVFQFNADGTFTRTRQIADAVTAAPVSYQFVASGKYSLTNDQLQLYGVSYVYSDTYGPIGQLTKTGTDSDVVIPIWANDTHTAFHFVYPPCPINASCIATLTYYKK